MLFVACDPIPIINIIFILIGEDHFAFLIFTMCKILNFLISIEIGDFNHKRIVSLLMALSFLFISAFKIGEVYELTSYHWLGHSYCAFIILGL